MSAKKASAAAQQTGNKMYLGPTIVGVVRHSTVFKDGVLPKRVKDCVAQLPMMEKLFVPLEEISAAVKELNKEKSVLGTVYAQIAKKFN
jgi:archaellum component FlaF (FlaF/FlaG flagellin family)